MPYTFMILSQHMPGGTGENHRTSIRTAIL